MEKINPSVALENITQFQSVNEKLRNIVYGQTEVKTKVVNASKNYIDFEVEKILKGIDIAEINRGNLSVRVSALKQAGFTDYYKVYKSSFSAALAKIKGISKENAFAIRREVYDAEKKVRAGIVPRFDAENKSKHCNALLQTLYVYMQSKPLIENATKLFQENSAQIENLCDEALLLTSKFKMFFASKTRKKLAKQSYDQLLALQQTYLHEGAFIIDELTEINEKKIAKIWDDFKANSASYYAVLENINGIDFDVVANKNGLSASLVEQIRSIEPDFSGLNCTLRSYQEFGTKYILHQEYVLLGDEMGLGKTVQAIAAMVAIRNNGENRFLVVCPASTLINWCREIKKHCDLGCVKMHGEDRDEAFKDWMNYGGVGVTTYETLDKLDFSQANNISMVIADEAHYVKNPKANRTINLTQVCDKSNRVLFMTGTALENNVDEMCFLIGCLDKDVAKSIEDMKHLAAAPIFREKVSPVYLRRTREDVLQELPALVINEEWCDMTEEEKRNYFNSTMSENFMAMRQVSWDVADMASSSKGARLLEIYNRAKEEKRKVIVFSFFLNTIKQAQTLLGNANCFGPINGSVEPQKRQEIIDAFSKGPDGSVLLAQIQAGGTGVNIQAASCVVLCEPQLKPSTENQAISRTYRMGQTRNVQVFKLLCEDSVDERVVEILREKETLFENFADVSVVGKQSIEIDAKASKNIVAKEKERLSNQQKR